MLATAAWTAGGHDVPTLLGSPLLALALMQARPPWRGRSTPPPLTPPKRSRALERARQRGGGRAGRQPSPAPAAPAHWARHAQGSGVVIGERRPGADHRLPDPRGRTGAAGHRRWPQGAGAGGGLRPGHGFGLVQALAPLGLEPAPLGRPPTWPTNEPLMVASGGDDGAVSAAQLVSRRAFSGYWEYHIDGRCSPRRRADHSGAGLFNGARRAGGHRLAGRQRRGRWPAGPHGRQHVRAGRPAAAHPARTAARGRSRTSRAAWLGVNCVEVEGACAWCVSTRTARPTWPAWRSATASCASTARPVATLDALWKALWQRHGRRARGAAADRARRRDPQT
jgi:hypothetical protein